MFKFPQNIILVTLLSVCFCYGQNSDNNIYKNFASQSFLKQNTFLLNPTFTVVNSESSAISILNRSSFTAFNNSPELNIIGYSGSINENMGAGLALFQQRIGAFTSFGALANYAHTIRLTKNSDLSIGFNFIINKVDLDRSRIVGNAQDPNVINFVDSFFLVLQPAINYRIDKFSVGIYLKDLVDYNLNTKEFVTPFSDKNIAFHAMYTQPLELNSRILEGSSLQLIANTNSSVNSNFTGSLVFDVPKFGWLQTGYDNFFGVTAGLGIHISKKIAISYVYEQGKNSLGNTNEIGLSYTIGNSKRKVAKPITEKQKLKPKKLEEKKVKEIVEQKLNEDNITDATINKPIRTTTVRKIKDITPGHYLVVNVFSIAENAENFIKTLKEENYKPKYFIHPETNYRYVYIAKTATRAQMLKLLELENLNRYSNDKWILHVEN